MVWWQAGARPKRWHLGGATSEAALERAGRSGRRPTARGTTRACLESCSIPPSQRAIDALLQGRPRSSALVGHAQDIDRQRSALVQRTTASARRAGPDQEQARATCRWQHRQSIEHGAGALAHSFPSTQLIWVKRGGTICRSTIPMASKPSSRACCHGMMAIFRR